MVTSCTDILDIITSIGEAHSLFFYSMFFKKPVQPAQPPPVHEPSKPEKIYPLVIGINEYPADRGWQSLNGAVANAEDFKSFLIDTLKVSSRNIQFMRDACHRDTINVIARLKD